MNGDVHLFQPDSEWLTHHNGEIPWGYNGRPAICLGSLMNRNLILPITDTVKNKLTQPAWKFPYSGYIYFPNVNAGLTEGYIGSFAPFGFSNSSKHKYLGRLDKYLMQSLCMLFNRVLGVREILISARNQRLEFNIKAEKRLKVVNFKFDDTESPCLILATHYGKKHTIHSCLQSITVDNEKVEEPESIFKIARTDFAKVESTMSNPIVFNLLLFRTFSSKRFVSEIGTLNRETSYSVTNKIVNCLADIIINDY